MWLGAAVVALIHPCLDLLVGPRRMPPPKWPANFYDFYILITGPLLAYFLFSSFQKIHHVSTFEFSGILVSTGLVMGFVGINTSHELVHRQSAVFRSMGFFILSLMNFGHWGIEHVFGHHKWVATTKDPATSRLNEWIYPYWVKSYSGGLQSSWKIESQRLKNRSLPRQLLSHRVLIFFTISIAVSVLIFKWLGSLALGFWWGQSLVAILLLQTVDYIEHYGLARTQTNDGQYEPVRPEHSWDCDYFFTNANLLNLGYHSYHHRKPLIPYQELAEHCGPRKMPYGYSVMILIALVPPLWFRVMNPIT